MEEWQRWYSGYDDVFHHYVTPSPFNEKGVKRKMYSMRMGTKLPQDMASFLLNERTTISVDDENSNIFINGGNGVTGLLRDNNFYVMANQLMEKVAALGTGAIVLRIKDAYCEGEYVRGGSIGFEYIAMPNIIPLSWENDRITEVAFCSKSSHRGREVMYIETHTLEDDGYVVTNYYLEDVKGQLVECEPPDGVVPVIRTFDKTPLFAIFKLNITNQLAEVPLGVSMFAGAIDNLKAVDLAFHNFCVDFQLGRKMVFLKQDLVGSMLLGDGTKRAVTPQECEQNLFTFIGTDNNGDSDFIREFNPMLRVNENVQGVQAMLNYLSAKVGFGEAYYQFDSRQGVTATQIISENSTLYRNIVKHNILLEDSIVSLIRGALWLGQYALGFDVNCNASVNVLFDDSIIEDKHTKMNFDLILVREGIMTADEYREKYLLGN